MAAVTAAGHLKCARCTTMRAAERHKRTFCTYVCFQPGRGAGATNTLSFLFSIQDGAQLAQHLLLLQPVLI